MAKRFRQRTFKTHALIAVLLFAVLALAAGGIWMPVSVTGSVATATPAVEGDGVHYLGCLPTDPTGFERMPVPGAGRQLCASVDLSSDIPPPGQQGTQNSCIGWASSYCYRSWSEKENDPSRDLTDPADQFSPSFVYNQINGGVDAGSRFGDAFTLMQDEGDISIKQMPYDENDFTTQPTASQLNAAEQYRISSDWGYFWVRQGNRPYSPPNGISDIKAWLAGGDMLAMSIPIYNDFPDYNGNPSSPYYDYDGTSLHIGGHGVAIVGYDDNINPGGSDADHRGGFLMANSWGANWNGASKGFVYLSYDFVKRYAHEAWAMNNPSVANSWYLAEGSTDWGFECYVTIENPNSFAVNCDVTYMTTDGEVAGPTVNLPAKSQATVNPFDTLGSKDFSTKVECREGEKIAVDRSMLWTAQSEWPEAHCSIGVTSPDETWYLAEGSSAWGFECWLLIQNPNQQNATCQVTYMIEGEGPRTFEKSVPAGSRKTYNMADDIGSKDASIKVESDVPVIPERAMYRNSRREGHDSIGTTTPTRDYYLAEGATGYESNFTTYVLVQNPNDTPTDVTVTYMTATGPVEQPEFKMAANSRKTIRVNDVLPANTDFSTAVEGSQPIIAERAMYWYGNPNTGEVCHDSIGMSSPHANFYLPAGGTSNDWETWTLVQNPNDSEVTVEISYLMPDGQNNIVWLETIPARSRKSFNMADWVPDGSAAVMVRSLEAPNMVMVERAMYWYGRNAGTSTIGGYSDLFR